jgi:two-component system chemotaxis sensor kinase CheA
MEKTMDKIKLMQRLMGTFLEELEEHVRALNCDLLALEKSQDGAEPGNVAERLKTLFRTTHSLKGAARAVNADVIEKACHQLEEILTAVRGGLLPFDADLFALLFATADGLEEAGMRLREQRDLSGALLATLLPRLEAATRGLAVPSKAASESVRAVESDSAEAGGSAGAPEWISGRETSETFAEPVGGSASLRVSAEKLDAFLARNGELLTARLRVQSRTEEVAALRDAVGRCRSEWRMVEKGLRPLSAPGDGNQRRWPAELPRHLAQALGQTGAHLRQFERDLERLAGAMAGDGRHLDQVGHALDEEVRRVRMLPFAEACQGLERVVRDLARAGGKEVQLSIRGGTVELDRSVLEGLKDPLRHLVRNAVDHGLEAREEREAAGKPGQGQITVSAVLRGSQLEVTVGDDGRGLNLEALRQQVRRRRLPEPADERELARLIFLPGLSTARMITDVSGRGVGLDVVKSQVEALHGSVDVAFTPGRGTRFTLAVPLTLTTLPALLFTAGGQTLAVLSTNVQKLMRVDPADFRSVEGRDMILVDGPPIPVVSLADTLGLGPIRKEGVRGQGSGVRDPESALTPGRKVQVIIVAAGEKRLAFTVDELLAEREIVIKGLGARIRRVRHVSGATILPSGQVALVLNVAEIVHAALGRTPARARAAAPAESIAEARKSILIAEDSITTRTLEKSILEAAGYEVTVAADGTAAWQMLQDQGADLLVSDVDMPGMDGFALTEAVRGSKRFKDLPTILVTARETEEDKTRGIAVGADAYLLKSAFDQTNLLETIAQLL